MKKVLFAIVSVFFALFLVSCGNTENKQAEAQKPVESTTVNQTTNDNSAIYTTQSVEVSEIAKITDPEQARRIWLDENGEVSRVALAKWEALMKTKIASINDPEQARRIWLDENGEVSRVALARYKALGGGKN